MKYCLFLIFFKNEKNHEEIRCLSIYNSCKGRMYELPFKHYFIDSLKFPYICIIYILYPILPNVCFHIHINSSNILPSIFFVILDNPFIQCTTAYVCLEVELSSEAWASLQSSRRVTP